VAEDGGVGGVIDGQREKPNMKQKRCHWSWVG